MRVADKQDIRVIVVHPAPLLTLGLASALREQAGIRVQLPPAQAGEAADVAVTNYELGLRMVAAGRHPPDRPAGPRVLVVANQEREHEVRVALEAGVHGFIVEDCRPEELVDCVRALAMGQRYLCMTVARCIAESMSREALTTRESEVLALLAGGYCNKAIARQLDIAVGTVKAHVKGILSKLEVSTRTQAASVAVSRGLVNAFQQRAGIAAERTPVLER